MWFILLQNLHGYEFLMKELAVRFNTKVHVSLCQYQLYQFVPSIHTGSPFRWRNYQNPFLQAVVYVCELRKKPCKPGISSPEVPSIIPTAMFFTKNDKMPDNLLKARSDRNCCCCYSLHSSASEIIDFLSSLHFESNTSFVCPDKDTPLDSVKAFIIKKLKHRNPNPSNDATTKLWKERIKFNERDKRKFYLKKLSTNTPDYEYHKEPLRQKRRFVESRGFEGKDSETAETVKNKK